MKSLIDIYLMSSGSRVSSNTTPGLKAVFATANIHIIRKTPEPIRTFFCGISHSSRERLMQDQNIKVLLHNYLDLKIVWKSTHEKRKIHPWEEENLWNFVMKGMQKDERKKPRLYQENEHFKCPLLMPKKKKIDGLSHVLFPNF